MGFRIWLVIGIIGFGWGLIYFFNEVMIRELGPMTVSLGRISTGALALWVVILITRRTVRIGWPVAFGLVFLGLFNYAFPFTIYPAAQSVITSTATGIINALTPIMVVVVASLWRGAEATPLHKWVGVILGLAGIVLLSQSSGEEGDSALWGLVLAMFAPLCYGIALNYARYFKSLDPIVVTAVALTGASIVYAPVALTIEGMPVVTPSTTLWSMFMAGPILTGALFAVFYWLIQQVGPVVPSTVTFIAPVSATLMGVFALNEPFTLWHVGGIVLIFCALLVIDGALLRRFGLMRVSG